ncbi:ThiF family adenylyltransferase [Undibacterium seohonense]|uniref:ThiF family adenylyltransferase n=1 Tax=Undibacterium seohonense TaxID=1344950 RepID=A0ABR6X3Q0_9BURK|nr:ThiF family adenylyltransferase [Undibacterium seohonense]MBC3806986.1 ThiF family adenylyltransferase [Undibacterium seohonense]
MHKVPSAICNEIDLLLSPYGARRLSSKEIANLITQSALFGWQITTSLVYKNEPVVINLLFCDKSESQIPIIAVAAPEIEPCEIPHIEEHGRLCVWPSRYIVDKKNNSYILELLSDAEALLKEAFDGNLDTHFEDEFQSYWAYHPQCTKKTLSLCDLERTSTRLIATFESKKLGVIMADSSAQIENWLDNQGLLPTHSKKKIRRQFLNRIEKSVLLQLKHTWRPTDFPNTAKELFSIIKKEFADQYFEIATMLAISLTKKTSEIPTILVQFNTSNGVALIAIHFSRSIFRRVNRRAIIDGFRNEMPLSHFIERTSTIKITGGAINRADKNWLAGRDSNPSHKIVGQHRIVLIGCGSVGAAIIRLLIQSGFTDVVLIDFDKYGTENSSRHILGLDSFDTYKATALANKLGREFPHISINAINKQWQGDAIARTSISRADIILSCTGDWQSDQSLLQFQSEEELGVIVFAFVEAHAIAGHVIVNPPNSNAFNSIHYVNGNKIGTLITPCTTWPHETIQKIPACAGEFQPYGAIPLTHLQAIAAKTILSLVLNPSEKDVLPYIKIWLGDRSELEKLGGHWNHNWISSFGDPGFGNKEVTLIFEKQKWKEKYV